MCYNAAKCSSSLTTPINSGWLRQQRDHLCSPINRREYAITSSCCWLIPLLNSCWRWDRSSLNSEERATACSKLRFPCWELVSTALAAKTANPAKAVPKTAAPWTINCNQSCWCSSKEDDNGIQIIIIKHSYHFSCLFKSSIAIICTPNFCWNISTASLLL